MHPLLLKFLNSGMVTFKDGEQKRHVAFINSFSVFGIITQLFFGILNYVNGATTTGLIEMLFGTILVVNLIILRILKHRWVLQALIIMMFSMGIPLIALLFLGGIAGTGVFWFFTYPVLSFFIWRKQVGILWVAGLCAAVLIVALLAHYDIVKLYYSLVQIRQLIIAIVIVSLLLYIFRDLSDKQERLLGRQEVTISGMSGYLEEALRDAHQSEEFLKQRTSALELQKTDLEESRRATLNLLEDLEEAKASNEAMLASIGDALVAINKEAEIILANKAFEDMLGLKAADILGKSLFRTVPMIDEGGNEVPDSERLATRTLTKHVVTTSSNKKTLYFRRKDGARFPVAITVSPIMVGGELTGAVQVFRDITAEKAIDKAKTEFVSLASHQLRTPLATINWYAEMLLSGDAGTVSDKQRLFLDEIYNGSRRMVDLVNALLSVSRIEMGTLASDPAETNVCALAESVLHELTPQIMEKKLNVEKKFSGHIPPVSVDPKLLRVIFQNLLSNAVKYTPEEGSITLVMSLDRIDYRLTIRVSDTGLGIPAEQQKNIFTKLFRADNVREQDTDGTGLGLYLVKSIVENAGGSIWFESAENKGSTFHVLLPVEIIEE